MAYKTDTLSELAKYLNDQLDQIVQRWMQTCERDKALTTELSKLSKNEFRNNIPAAIEVLQGLFESRKLSQINKQAEEEIAKHGHHRWKQGFSLLELIRDWGNLNRILVTVVEEFYRKYHPAANKDRAQAFDLLAKFLTEATSQSVRRYDELRQAEAASLAADLKLTAERFEQNIQARSQLLRETAHDLRGGLQAIAGASDVLKFTGKPNASYNQVLESLDRGVESVKDMLNALLDLSRLESGADKVNLLTVDIGEVLAHLALEYKAAASSKNLNLRTEGPIELYIQTDPKKLRRIAQNLVINALQHTTSGEVKLAWAVAEKGWELCVTDTGAGFQASMGSPTAQELNHSDSGHSSYDVKSPHAYSGEGIGLLIVKRLCTMLDATISLESELGTGTTITVKFPEKYS